MTKLPTPTAAIRPTLDRRRSARTLGLLYLVLPAFAELWLVHPHPPADEIALLVVCVLAQALGAGLLGGVADTAPAWALKGLMTAATLLVAGLCVFSGTTDNDFAYLFLWTTPCAFLFGARHAIVQGALAVAALVGARMLVEGNPFTGVGPQQWLIPVATLVVVGAMIHRLIIELGRADRDCQRSRDDRAELESLRAASEHERARREAAIGRLGRSAVHATDRQELLDAAVAIVTQTLDVEHCTVFELVDDGDRVRLAAGMGLLAGAEEAEELPVEDRLLTGWVLASEEAVVVWEWASERRFDAAALRSRGIRSTVAVGVRGRMGAFGVIAVHAPEVGAFSAEDGKWLESAADLLASALDREQSEALVRHQSLHDALTGLPNRALFYDRVGHAFSRAERDGTAVAVLLLDVDQFKTINDSLGHKAGDDLLVALSARLLDVTRNSDTVARLGGDEFVVLCEVESEAEAFAIADRIAQSWEQPIRVGTGGEVFVSASVGIAVAHEQQAAEKMLREADAAMYRAKESGRGCSELFDEDMRQRAFERLRTESDLRRAVEREQFRVHYQPIFDMVDGQMTGVEALVRWERPGQGLVGPGEFIELAEETGLITELGRWVLDHATADASAWRASHPDAADLRVTVNVSGHQLVRPEFLDEVRGALRRSGLAPGNLGLEITESVLMNDVSPAHSTLHALRALGVRVLLDDFGTGYSSLARLKGFPVDAIKVDRSFVDGLGSQDEDTAIVGAIVEIADSLGLEAIAEGVERPEQVARLRELGCSAAQGYLFAMPMPCDELQALLADHSARRPARLSA